MARWGEKKVRIIEEGRNVEEASMIESLMTTAVMISISVLLLQSSMLSLI